MNDKPETTEFKVEVEVVGKIGGCQILVSTTANGKKHFEASCASKEGRDKLAAIFDEEAILRVNPKAILEESPPAVPVTES